MYGYQSTLNDVSPLPRCLMTHCSTPREMKGTARYRKGKGLKVGKACLCVNFRSSSGPCIPAMRPLTHRTQLDTSPRWDLQSFPAGGYPSEKQKDEQVDIM
jgi:hypothetical protein